MNTTRSSFHYTNTPRTSWFQCGHTPFDAEDSILEPDPIGPPNRITVVPFIDSVPLSLQRDLLSLLATPTVMDKIPWRCSVQGNNQQQEERVTTTTTEYTKQHQLQRNQAPTASSFATLCVSQHDLSPKESGRTYAPVFTLQSDGCMSPLLFSFTNDLPTQPHHGMRLNPTTTIPQRTKQQEEVEKQEMTSSSRLGLRISELQQAKWMEFFLALCDYKMKHGSFNVPVATSCLQYDTSLGLWVKRLRHQYKRYHQGKDSSLTPERVELLSSVGFQWQVQDDMWRDRFRQLEEFAQTHGHIRVPLKGSTAGLHNWIKRQRKQYRLFKEGKTSSMSTERYEKLRILGSCFSGDNGSFGY